MKTLTGSVIPCRAWGRLPLAVSSEPAQPLDAAPVAATETELERLRGYLEVSQAMLEAVEREM